MCSASSRAARTLPESQGRGRPRVQLGFNGARNAVIGVWIGQDEIELTLVDAAGNRLAERSIVTPLKSLSNADVLKRLAGLIAKFGRERLRDIKIAGIGIACQGYVDSETGPRCVEPGAGRRATCRWRANSLAD